MTKKTPAKLSREQLYNEIWEISVAGVSKKYDVPYAELLKLCKENEIPIPPSGYWTKLKFGKPVTKTPLTESAVIEVILPENSVPKKRSRRTTVSAAPAEVMVDPKKEESSGFEEQAAEETEVSEEQLVDDSKDNQLTYRTVDGQRNVYNREKLYKEVWAKPVVDVAVQYGVSDVAIHKICKSLNVPVPPRGYWAKLRAGAKLKKPPLPATKGATEIIGARTFEGVKFDASSQPLAFMTESERQKVLLAVEQIKMPAENAQLHKKIAAYRSVVKEWNKNDTKPEGAKRGFKNYSNRPPFLAGVISTEALPRVYRILDALFRQVESLGGYVNEDLSLQIRDEYVQLEVSEAQDEIKHVITKKEAQEILVYEDAKRRHSWASEPQIRKYDYIFNGRLRISIRQHRHFRDTDKVTVEFRLGDILIALYEESEVVRIEREAREEDIRKKQEEARLKEERRNRYNNEVEQTIALQNAARDYETACRIRAFVKAVETMSNQGGLDDETAAWIDWANKKADWFDPTVARDDELLGEREHEKSEKEKALEKLGRYWW